MLSPVPVHPPPPVVPPPSPPPAIATTPTHVAARPWQPTLGAFWTADWFGSTWEASAGTPTGTFILVHGGPAAADSLEGMDNFAGRFASSGARAIAVRYPTLGVHWTDALAPIEAAIAAHRPCTVVAHSLGGFFGSLAAYRSSVPLVLIAADDQIGAEYRAVMGNGPDARALMAESKVPVTVIVGSEDPITTVAEAQNLVDALHATGHPGRFLVVDGADHDTILSDAGVIAAILGG